MSSSRSISRPVASLMAQLAAAMATTSVGNRLLEFCADANLEAGIVSRKEKTYIYSGPKVSVIDHRTITHTPTRREKRRNRHR